MTSTLALKLVSSYEGRAKESREYQQNLLEERRLLETAGPKRWQELRDCFRETIAEVNVKLNSDMLQWHDTPDQNSIKISRRGTGLFVNGVFESVTRTLTITGPNDYDVMTYEQKVLGDDVQFVTTRQTENLPQTSDQIVEKALGKLLY